MDKPDGGMLKSADSSDKKKQKNRDPFGVAARHVASASGKPITFLTAVSVIIVWALTGPLFNFNDTWQLVINTCTSTVTFLMVFLIQNTQNRDTAALQLKLDEIIRAIDAADDNAMFLEDRSQEELDLQKKKYQDLANEAEQRLDTVPKAA